MRSWSYTSDFSLGVEGNCGLIAITLHGGHRHLAPARVTRKRAGCTGVDMV
jgi:hypothetical protein